MSSIHEGLVVRTNFLLFRSPDLTALDFFVWGFLKQEFYRREIASLQDLNSWPDEALVKLEYEFSLRVRVI